MSEINGFLIDTSSKALIIVFGILSLLVVFTVFNFYRTTSAPSQDIEFTENGVFAINVRHVPEIVRSYENVKDIYGKKGVLFLRFVNTSCNSCYNSQLNALLVFQDEIGKDNVWIFPAYPDDRNSRIQLSSELSKFNYRNIPADSLHIPIYEGEQKSYFGWIGREGDIEMVFIPNRSNDSHTCLFFLEVKKKLQQLSEN